MNKQVPIVAIGASAGGLEAISLLLAQLEPSFSYAVIILQHLSPNYKSMMPELLIRETRLNVHTLENGTIPVAGNVYVVPPNYHALLSEQCIELIPALAEVAPKPNINDFFCSLAKQRGAQAIGVVLSGTGSDGAKGLKAIREAGGLTLAQLPETAKYAGMPSAAIDAGGCEEILSPQAIAAKLLQLPGALLDEGEVCPSVLEEILTIVNDNCQLDFSGYRVGTLSRRIRRRMVTTNHTQMAEYLEYLRDSVAEQSLLSRDMLISVTAFFRDKEAFDSLTENLLKQAVNLTPKDSYRVWVAGCATGEEVYSIAIVLLEAFAQLELPNSVQIFATDIDDEALEFARAGVYPEPSVAGLPEAYLSKYFTRNRHGRYEVHKRLRDMVVFAHHNFISDPPFLRLNLVTCRNVLIYFDNVLQAKVLGRFNFALRDYGLLFLGRSESIAQAEQLFDYVDRRERIFEKSVGLPERDQLPLTKKLPTLKAKKKDTPQNLVDALTDYQGTTVALCNSDYRVLQTSGQVGAVF